MTENDIIGNIISQSRDKFAEKEQKALLTQLSLSLDKIELQKDPSGSSLQTEPKSNLPQILNLCVNHADGFELDEKYRIYLEGWQHCLLALKGGMKSLQISGSNPKVDEIPSTEVGNPFMN